MIINLSTKHIKAMSRANNFQCFTCKMVTKKPTGIDKKGNCVTVTLCINNINYGENLSFNVRFGYSNTHTHTSLTALCPGQPRWAGTTKVKPIWILLEQETVSGSGISWAICKSAPRSRQIAMPAPHYSFFFRPDALPATQPTVSKHWRHIWMQ